MWEIFGSKYSRMDQVKFVATAFKKFEEIWFAFTFSKGCLPQILLGPFFNPGTHEHWHEVYFETYCFFRKCFTWDKSWFFTNIENKFSWFY